MVHRRFAQRQPMARALNDPFARMNDDETSRSRPVQRQRKCFEWAQRDLGSDRIVKRRRDDQQLVGLADGFLAPRRQLAVGEKDDRCEPALERVQRFREVEVVNRPAVEYVGDRAARDDESVGAGTCRLDESRQKCRRDVAASRRRRR